MEIWITRDIWRSFKTSWQQNGKEYGGRCIITWTADIVVASFSERMPEVNVFLQDRDIRTVERLMKNIL